MDSNLGPEIDYPDGQFSSGPPGHFSPSRFPQNTVRRFAGNRGINTKFEILRKIPNIPLMTEKILHVFYCKCKLS
jgi:hypothetical protein